MNILILVGSFLLILSFGAAALFKNSTNALLGQTYFFSTMHVDKQAHNAAQHKLYTKAIKREPKTKEQKEKEEAENTNIKHVLRDKAEPGECSKLCIAQLFSPTSPAFDQLYEIAATLLKILYKETIIGQEAAKAQITDFEYRILDAMIEQAHTTEDCSSFVKISPQDPALRKIYAKMVRGTKHYDLHLHQGYPPLEDFFMLASEESKPIYFCFASTPLLKAIFGADVAQAILDEEGKNPKGRRALTRDALTTLLSRHGDPKMQFAYFSPIMSFTRSSKTAKSVSYTDKHTNIRHKLPIKQKK